MIGTHASPACQAGIAHYWERALGDRDAVRRRIAGALEAIRDGRFARHLLDEQRGGYPELAAWRLRRSSSLVAAEDSLRRLLRQRPGSRSA
jgi:ketol-acid reductoisomerase